MQLILASGSARRLHLLRDLALDPTVMVPDIDETPLPGEAAAAHVERLARGKCAAILERVNVGGDSLVVAADTIVCLDGEILGKPADRRHAIDDLQRLSGRRHDVMTGLAVAAGGEVRSAVETTAVQFADLSASAIEWYVATGEADDKAGSYAMQGRGGLFVTSIAGSYDNVIGLPRHRLSILAAELGFRLIG